MTSFMAFMPVSLRICNTYYYKGQAPWAIFPVMFAVYFHQAYVKREDILAELLCKFKAQEHIYADDIPLFVRPNPLLSSVTELVVSVSRFLYLPNAISPRCALCKAI